MNRRLLDMSDPFKPKPVDWKVVSWIKQNLPGRRQSINWSNSSYGLKHRYEWDTGNYCSEAAFTRAMRAAGFRVQYYRRSARSNGCHYFNTSKRDINRIYKEQASGERPLYRHNSTLTCQ